MIIVMKKSATQEDIQQSVRNVEALGLKANIIQGTERTVIAAVGEERVAGISSLESGPGVDEVISILAPYKMASREVKPESTTVRAGSLTVGNGQIGVIAGPCSVENERQIIASAHAVKTGRRDGTARRSVQATNQPLQFPGAQGRRPQVAGQGPR